ncbi:dephospho-CoA kinase [Acetobacterium wieringae]|uniref:dephospho-CoA kinase n=1 Tax=Acetobacterium wieringae TaxID=52694 RepID=UPI002B204577|nr:dephospho-CoA kinase [Acetobacterium wieringae]MEA4804707.1 dephospho-CoA kinase [Acetobacterium wieringae]
MRIIGITGGIASGKSTVTDILKKRFNYIVIDADQLARQAVEPESPGLKKIIMAFGETVIDENGELNRSMLGEIIANNDHARTKLNAMIHPEVKKLYDQQISFYRKSGIPTVFYDCPLLFETNLQNTVDETILVVADKEIRIERIMNRDNLTREQAIRRIEMQMSDEEKIALADTIIENNGSMNDLLITINVYFSRRKLLVR